MNSEELELSLRTEFESYLNDILAEMRQEVSGFQAKFQDEFEKHKSHLDEVFRDFSSRLENDKHLDEGFRESVVEHLRLAKDEGARITASAIAEAEDREKENSEMLAAASGSYSEIRDAINEISSQDSQAGILKSLVSQAAQFTPRGAFFIIKNEHFVGWRVFGKEGTSDEQTVREIFFPMSNETVLSDAVRSLSAVESNYGTYSDDSFYLDKLEFGQPDRMYAIPLVARGRGVAVLYADYGTEGVNVNIEVLETLVRVAGLTVELLAASQGTKTQTAPGQTTQSVNQSAQQTAVAETFQQPAVSEPEGAQNYQVDNNYEKSEPVQESYNSSFGQSDTASEDTNYAQTETNPNTFQTEPASDNFQSYYQEFSAAEDEKSDLPGETASETDYSWSSPPNYSDKSDEAFVVEEFNADDEKARTAEFNYEAQEPTQDYSKTSSYDFETPLEQFPVKPQAENEIEIPQFESANGYSEQVYEAKTDEIPETYSAPEPAETASSAAATPVKSRLSERNVDLPIEVAEDERRLHNDARRFARLLVSEIKLYNEQKVKEGRESSDLYERLREAIDRSREMYEKRVQPPVAAKFDYFHYELINSLAEGEEGRLGRSYPGTKV